MDADLKGLRRRAGLKEAYWQPPGSPVFQYNWLHFPTGKTGMKTMDDQPEHLRPRNEKEARELLNKWNGQQSDWKYWV